MVPAAAPANSSNKTNNNNNDDDDDFEDSEQFPKNQNNNRRGSVAVAVGEGGGRGAKASSIVPAFLNDYKWLETIGERCYSANNEKKLQQSKGKLESFNFLKTHMLVLCTICKEYGNGEWSAFKLTDLRQRPFKLHEESLDHKLAMRNQARASNSSSSINNNNNGSRSSSNSNNNSSSSSSSVKTNEFRGEANILLNYDWLCMYGDKEYSKALQLKDSEPSRDVDKDHAILICKDCFLFNSDSSWAKEKFREIRTKHFDRHVVSEEHKLALTNKCNSDDTLPYDGQIGHKYSCTLCSEKFYSNPPGSYRNYSLNETLCLQHHKRFNSCRTCKLMGVKGAGSGLCDQHPTKKKKECLECMSLEDVRRCNFICRICLTRRTRNFLCKACCGRLTGSAQGRLESFVLESIYRAFPGTNLGQGQTLGKLEHCKDRVPGNVATNQEKGCEYYR